MSDDVAELLEQYRAARRAFEARLRALDDAGWAAPLPANLAWTRREVVIHIAAWLAEGGERIPSLMAGAEPHRYDADAFNAAAVERARDWTPLQAFGAYRRAADRFEVIAAELTDAVLDEEPDVRAWLTAAARVTIAEHLADIPGPVSR